AQLVPSTATPFGETELGSGSSLLLPLCTAIGQTCPPPPGVLCDCGFVKTSPLEPDQQGSTRYLNPHPLTVRCSSIPSTLGLELDARPALGPQKDPGCRIRGATDRALACARCAHPACPSSRRSAG